MSNALPPAMRPIDEPVHAIGVKALFMVVLVVVVIGAGMKVAGMELPFIDYPVGPMGIDAGPIGPRIEVQAPGFDEFGP